MATIVHALSVALLSLPLFAGSASAECAWVMHYLREGSRDFAALP